MIYVDFLTNNAKQVIGARLAGHSGYAEIGSDIVCAAVSSAVYMAVNTIGDVLEVKLKSLRVDEDGELFFRISDEDADTCKVIVSGLALHLKSLEEQYPEHISINYMEV